MEAPSTDMAVTIPERTLSESLKTLKNQRASDEPRMTVTDSDQLAQGGHHHPLVDISLCS